MTSLTTIWMTSWYCFSKSLRYAQRHPSRHGPDCPPVVDLFLSTGIVDHYMDDIGILSHEKVLPYEWWRTCECVSSHSMVEKLCSMLQDMVDHYIDDIMILLYMTTRNKLTNGWSIFLYGFLNSNNAKQKYICVLGQLARTY